MALRNGYTFKRRDKVVCINNIPDVNDPDVDLTLGKVYEILEDSFFTNNIESVFIYDDDNSVYDYSAYRFIGIIEYRDNVINDILL